MRLKFDGLLSRLISELHYKCDRYDPEWPDLHSAIVNDSMLRAFEVLGLVKRTRDEAGRISWRSTSELKRLAKRRIAKPESSPIRA